MANIPSDLKVPVNEMMEKLMRSAGAVAGQVAQIDWCALWDQGTDSDPTFGAVSATSLSSATAASLPIVSSVANGANVAVKLAASVDLTNASAKILSIGDNNAVSYAEKLAIDLNGKLVMTAGGAAAVVGTSGALSAGTVTVNTTSVTAASKIFLTRAVAGGTLGHLSVGAIVAGTSFAITSSDAGDTSTINFWIIN